MERFFEGTYPPVVIIALAVAAFATSILLSSRARQKEQRIERAHARAVELARIKASARNGLRADISVLVRSVESLHRLIEAERMARRGVPIAPPPSAFPEVPDSMQYSTDVDRTVHWDG